MDLFKPRGVGSPRNPTTDKQNNGQIVNTPRFEQLGGLSSPNKIGPKNQFTIKPPGDGKKVI
jgi:hypothetical protein